MTSNVNSLATERKFHVILVVVELAHNLHRYFRGTRHSADEVKATSQELMWFRKT